MRHFATWIVFAPLVVLNLTAGNPSTALTLTLLGAVYVVLSVALDAIFSHKEIDR